MKLTKELNSTEVCGAKLPIMTSSYTPISNREIVDLVREEAYKNNLIINGERYISNNKMTQFIGQYFIYSDIDEIGMQVAFKNSYDKTMPFQTAAGGVVFICSNSMIGGEIMFKRKHTGDADATASEKITETFKLLGDYFEQIKGVSGKLKEMQVGLKEVSEFTGRLLFEKDVINTMQANIIKEELYTSKNFKHIDDDEFSMFDFYNHITESLKRSHPRTYIQDHINLHKFIVNEILK